MHAAVRTEFADSRGILLSNERSRKNTFSREPEQGLTAERADRLADVRQRVVARGKLLVADPSYPNRRTVRGVARVLARHWRS